MHCQPTSPYAYRAKRSIPGAVRRVVLLVAALLALAGGALAGETGPAAPAERIWPLDLPEHYLTSNFMEYRPGRYHAGLDFKTRSRAGFVVRAVEDGWIARVRATPGAYGRAIYVHGESGRTYVYAHLMRFNDVIRAELAEARKASGRYRVRREFEPGRIPVQAGDVLGLSGQAGTLGPHLHFEVRDAAQRPLDPQAEGFAVRDTFPPVIRRLRALPAAAGARLGGGTDAMVLERADFPQGAPARLTLRGPVAFSARIMEQSDIRGHVLEPALLEVRLDGRIVFRSSNERFSFDEVGLQRLEWLEIPAQDGRPALRERWLHRRAGNTLPGREGGIWYLGPDGQGLQPGEHDLEIAAWDRAGGHDLLRVRLEVAAPRADCPPADPAWRVEPVQMCLVGATDSTTTCIRPLIDVDPEDLRGVRLRRFDPQQGDDVLTPVQVLYRWRRLEPGQLAQAAAQGLGTASSQLQIAAADWPLDGALPFELPATVVIPPDGEVYSWDGEEWDREGGLLQAARPGGRPQLAISSRRPHAVFADRVAPRFPGKAVELVFGPGESSPDPAVTMPRWEILPVALVDDGAGVDPASIDAQLDGRRLIVEPDLLRDRVLVELPDSCSAGPYELRVVAADRAGNGSEHTWTVRCRQP